MDKEFYLEVFNYKYNAWLPCEIIKKWDDKVIKIKCYVFKKRLVDGKEETFLDETFETSAFWKHIRNIIK